MEWTERVDRLLYDGETETRRVGVGDATIVVTSHRVLAFTPGDGPRYRAVDRPNVGRVTVESTGRTWALGKGLFFGVVALGSAITATLVSFTALVPDLGTDGSADPPSPGADIADEMVATLEAILTALELVVVGLAFLSGLAAAGYLVRYVRSRTRRLVIEVHGGEDIDVPVSSAVGAAAVELRNAIGPEPTLEGERASPFGRDAIEFGPSHDADEDSRGGASLRERRTLEDDRRRGLESGNELDGESAAAPRDDLESASPRGDESDPAFLERDADDGAANESGVGGFVFDEPAREVSEAATTDCIGTGEVDDDGTVDRVDSDGVDDDGADDRADGNGWDDDSSA
ncbi:hypothetical protein [Natrarchaeobaculum sulfurireducens]|uniref:Uncharacterized protein n=1 Tax=Natrarchaeobaculum sulfurireducens TaxID=2044521 RepID=A0A346PJ03_9EURY|nr:hypothetical protein [Natrarchaeobaculum sulfurireducens]AXR79498.1 hypothetical protein AArc1_3193 [Natrarchaeobaculum sulfurireducens]